MNDYQRDLDTLKNVVSNSDWIDRYTLEDTNKNELTRLQNLINEYIGDYEINDDVLIYDVMGRYWIKGFVYGINDSTMYPGRKFYSVVTVNDDIKYVYAYEMRKDG